MAEPIIITLIDFVIFCLVILFYTIGVLKIVCFSWTLGVFGPEVCFISSSRALVLCFLFYLFLWFNWKFFSCAFTSYSFSL